MLNGLIYVWFSQLGAIFVAVVSVGSQADKWGWGCARSKSRLWGHSSLPGAQAEIDMFNASF